MKRFLAAPLSSLTPSPTTASSTKKFRTQQLPVIARLSDSKIAELWAHLQTNLKDAPDISSTCKRLACYSPDGFKLSAGIAASCTRYSLNQKGYVQIKTSTATEKSNTNEKLQLHHLAIWHHPDENYRNHVREVLRNGKHKIEISHLCNFKQCCNPAHMYLESSASNKSRNYCIAFVHTLTGGWFPTCQHQPRCVYTTQSRIIELAGQGLYSKPVA